ncbi:host attachment protein [Yoonia sp. GPGPB17]|uniref:host attachment protein n=1 Tax=Yoonia sp. GPGPB17 TaxID=3026147 RepID=UPI0030BF7388
MKPIKTWIVLADAQTIRIAANEGPGKGIYGVPNDGLAAPAVTELSDAPGVMNAPVGPNRGGINEPDLKAQAAAAFAERIVTHLDHALQSGQFQRLVLCAAPAMLGILRQRLTGPLKHALRADIAKDLTHLPLNDLPAHLSDVMVV